MEGEPADLAVTLLPLVTQDREELVLGQTGWQPADDDLLALLDRFWFLSAIAGRCAC